MSKKLSHKINSNLMIDANEFGSAIDPIERYEFVYMLKCDCSPPRYKIGMSQKLLGRITAIKTASPFEVTLSYRIPTHDMRTLEKQFHSAFASKRVHREWFELSHDDIQFIISIAHNYENYDKQLSMFELAKESEG